MVLPQVKNLQNQLFTLVGLGLFVVGLWFTKRNMLHTNWRVVIGTTVIFLNCVDMVFVFCTIFDVVRDQYFYLGETVITEIPYGNCADN
jgi:hypothetical protein